MKNRRASQKKTQSTQTLLQQNRFLSIKTLMRFLSSLFLLGLILCSAVAVYIYYYVAYAEAPHLKRERIMEILARETVILYSDRTTQLGSLFREEHRQYVPIDEIPDVMFKAAIAAEDQHFLQHSGVDYQGLLRALYKNLFKGAREGGSTITMQTVKNLYGRSGNIYLVKFREIMNALKMERMYSKKEIMEFYLNQFGVASNGRGIGIAARYYFDKEPSKLNLVESAFIAATFKGNKYDPFIRTTPERYKKALEYGFDRKNYVIKRMRDLNFITEQEYEQAIKAQIPFKQGKFQFNDLALHTLLKRQLAKKEILKALNADSVDELATRGLRIITTLNKSLQESAVYAVRQNLSRLDIIMNGFKKDSAQNYKNRNSLEVLEFYTGKVVSVADNEIRLNFGNVDCLVPDDGIKRIANIYGQTLSNPKDARKLWLQNIQVSDYLFISVRSKEENNLYVCDVEQRPSVQGGLIVLDKGRVLAAVGGFFPHEFHRAIFAQRQPGSTMKPLVMYAALQLNWNIFDQIPNIRSAYTWQGQLYFPSAPHEPATPTSNFVGVGAMSENFASVWLSVHLLDKLSMDQYFDVLKFTSLFSEKESESMFLQRLAQNYKVSVGESSYQEGVFQRALYNYVNSLQNESSDFVLALLQTMLYGHNFDRLQRRINNASQLELLKNNWLRWQRIAENARWYIDLLKKEIENSSFNVQASLQYFRLTPNRELAFLSADALSLKKARLGEDVTLVPINVEDFKQLLTDNPNLLEHVKLDGIMPLHVIESLRVEIANEWQQYQQSAWPQKLYWNQEVRVLAGLQYITQMLKEFGTQSSMQPILSYALGANDITLTELALSYQTMIEGRVYQFFEEEYPNQLLLIQAIEDENGILLWEAQEKSVQVVDTQLSAPLLSVLRATVTHGTGRAADGALILRSKDLQLDNKLQKLRLRVPSFGKTGTTNRSVNALYVGFLPVPTEDNILTTENMLTIASYVGYDDNQPMKRLRGGGIAGAEGALPAWVKVAESVIKEFDFGSKLSWEGLEKGSVVPLQWDKTAERVYTSLYGKEINVASTGVNSEATNQDLNTFIDDNALAKAGFVEAHAPGRISGGVFTPHAFFNLVQSVSFVQSENLYVLQDSLNDTGSDKNKITSDEDFLDIPKEPFSSNESESNASEQKITPKDSTTSSETIPELPEPLSTAP